MRKLTAAIFMAIVATLSLHAQSATTLQEITERQAHLQRVSTLTLAGWSVANLAVSGIAIGQAEGSNRYFHEMNLYWNAVNVGIAGIGLLSLRKKHSSSTVSSVVKEHYALQNSLLLNTGLDLAYVTSGFWLLDKSKTELSPIRNDRFRGFGQAVIVQGGFLLVFDLTNYFIHRSDNPRLHRLLDTIAINGNGVSLKF
ncbi:hypothetical protein [Runella sp.]|jgi:acyl-ACP thioesterase|uniref:DUF6992 family protein n=1 Tax=Runella sp. TaxID=1960881 RepID=UPI00261DA60A|nr:hypothetical protein [Runella sp.]